MNKICIIIFFYFFFTANVFGFMSNPYDDFNRTQNSLHIEINKNTTENITLHFKHTSDDFSVFKMEDHATISNYTINNSYLEKQGVYEYYFTDNDSNRVYESHEIRVGTAPTWESGADMGQERADHAKMLRSRPSLSPSQRGWSR